LRDGHITSFPIEATVRIIRAMVEDAAGNLWVGTSKGNLLRIKGEKIAEESPRPPNELVAIRCLYPTPDGALWIGYAGAGIGRLKNGHYTEINSSQGLFDDYVSQHRRRWPGLALVWREPRAVQGARRGFRKFCGGQNSARALDPLRAGRRFAQPPGNVGDSPMS